jgi:hypothetical protein
MDIIAFFIILCTHHEEQQEHNAKKWLPSLETRFYILGLLGFLWYSVITTGLSEGFVYSFGIQVWFLKAYILLADHKIVQTLSIVGAVLANLTMFAYGLDMNVWVCVFFVIYLFLWFMNILLTTDLIHKEEEEEEETTVEKELKEEYTDNEPGQLKHRIALLEHEMKQLKQSIKY